MSQLNQLSERVAAQIALLLPAHSRVLIGLSGGVDSVVLLHILSQLAPRFSWQFSALHVHHGISQNADVWVEFCTGLCASYLVPLTIEHVDITPLREQHGIEASARKLRYAAFAKQLCDVVALAHHSDDQSETLLLQLLRGAGVRGASAMPLFSVRADPSAGSGRTESVMSILRPLLHCSRQEILDYAAAHQLQWIEDESNADNNYPRNFLRHRVLPLLEQKFPAYRDTLARSAQHFAEASGLLDELAQLDAQSFLPLPLREKEGRYDVALDLLHLKSLTQPRAKNLLRYFLHSLGTPMPQAVQLDEMLQQLRNAARDAVICISFGGWQVRRYQGRVYALRALGEFDKHIVMPWHGEADLYWLALNMRLRFKRTQGTGISLEKLQCAPVTLRVRQGGEALRPHSNAATRTLKNLLQEHHIPPWQRDRLPLLYCGDDLVCVLGVAIAADYQATADEAGISMVVDSKL